MNPQIKQTLRKNQSDFVSIFFCNIQFTSITAVIIQATDKENTEH